MEHYITAWICQSYCKAGMACLFTELVCVCLSEDKLCERTILDQKEMGKIGRLLKGCLFCQPQQQMRYPPDWMSCWVFKGHVVSCSFLYMSHVRRAKTITICLIKNKLILFLSDMKFCFMKRLFPRPR
jgi:hypothetical protein